MGHGLARLTRLLGDLKRRRVYHVTAVYLAVGFVIIEAADLLLPALPLDDPSLVYRLVVAITAAGLPVAIVLSWVYRIGPGGLERDRGEAAVDAPPAPPSLPAAGERRPSILVLPFEDLSPDSDAAYLCAGLTDEIITDLASIKAPVISRTSAMQLGRGGRDIETLRSELGVHYLLEGTVQKLGSSVRINVKLVDVTTGGLLWARKFRGELERLFDIQETISRNVADTLPLEIGRDEERLLSHQRIPDPKAHEYYLRARHEIFQFSEEAIRRGETYLERALEIMEDNVTLLAAMGYIQWQYVNAGVDPDPARLDRAEAYARRILELHPASPHAHRLFGLAAVHRGQARTAIRELETVLGADPNDSDALLWLSILYGLAGECERAAPLVDRILWLDPLPPLHQGLRGFLAVMSGDLEEGADGYRRAYELEPDNPILGLGYGQSLAMAGRHEEAVDALGRLVAGAPGSFLAAVAGFLIAGLEGDGDRVRALLSDELRGAGAADPQIAWTLAQGLALVGEVEEAVWFLRAGSAHGLVNRALLAEHDPLLRALRGDGAFQALIAGLPAPRRPAWAGAESPASP